MRHATDSIEINLNLHLANLEYSAQLSEINKADPIVNRAIKKLLPDTLNSHDLVDYLEKLKVIVNLLNKFEDLVDDVFEAPL